MNKGLAILHMFILATLAILFLFTKNGYYAWVFGAWVFLVVVFNIKKKKKEPEEPEQPLEPAKEQPLFYKGYGNS